MFSGSNIPIVIIRTTSDPSGSRKANYSRSTCWIVSISGSGGCHLEVSTFACVGHCSEYHHCKVLPWKHGICIWNGLAIWSTTWITVYPVWVPFWIFSFAWSDVRIEYHHWKPDRENMVFSLEMSLLSGLQAVLEVFPVWAAAIFNSVFWLHWAVFFFCFWLRV